MEGSPSALRAAAARQSAIFVGSMQPDTARRRCPTPPIPIGVMGVQTRGRDTQCMGHWGIASTSGPCSALQPFDYPGALRHWGARPPPPPAPSHPLRLLQDCAGPAFRARALATTQSVATRELAQIIRAHLRSFAALFVAISQPFERQYFLGPVFSDTRKERGEVASRMIECWEGRSSRSRS